MNWLVGLLLGVGMGVFSGLGVGGGKLLIPILIFFFSVEQHSAQGIALLAFLPIAAIAALVHYKEGNVDLQAALVLAVGAMGGALVGALLATSTPHLWLRKAYGFFLMGIALYEFFNKEGTEAESPH